MSARAGILVTGTEVLTGRVTDRNGPWVADRLLELGVELAHLTICGDRPADIEAQLRFLQSEGVDLIVTTGGLGPTADDMTVATVAQFCGLELVLDEAMESTVAGIVARWMSRSADLAADVDLDALRAANRKQAMVPAGSVVLDPVGTAPGVVVPAHAGPEGTVPAQAGPEGTVPAHAGPERTVRGAPGVPAVVVLPGPPKELQGMWAAAMATDAVAAAIAGRTVYHQETVRMFGLPESGLAETLRAADSIPGFDGLEITTCLRRGELEIVTRYEPGNESAYAGLLELLRQRHGRSIFSEDGRTVDELVAALLDGRQIVTAESCTAGLLAARLTDRPGSSAYVGGGVVAYANEAKSALLGVAPELIDAHGAVSAEVAEAMAAGAIERFGADTAVAITGVAGPGGGTPDKPVGTVWFCVMLRAGATVTRCVQIPGERSEVRERATTVAMHLLRRALAGLPSEPR